MDKSLILMRGMLCVFCWVERCICCRWEQGENW